MAVNTMPAYVALSGTDLKNNMTLVRKLTQNCM